MKPGCAGGPGGAGAARASGQAEEEEGEGPYSELPLPSSFFPRPCLTAVSCGWLERGLCGHHSLWQQLEAATKRRPLVSSEPQVSGCSRAGQ